MTPKRPFAIDIRYEVVSPLFIAGADQASPELRPASLRGAVRAWYRAVDPRFRVNEGRWFGAAFEEDGGTAERRGEVRASPWRTRIVASTLRPGFKVSPQEYRSFDQGKPPRKTNGVLYTGYTLIDRFNQREGFHPSTAQQPATFDVRLSVLPHLVHDLEGFTWALLGSHWLLGHLGGLGSRARRGWGSVQLRSMQPAAGSAGAVPGDVLKILEMLAPARVSTVTDWAADLKHVLGLIDGHFGHERVGDAAQTPHLGPQHRVLVMRSAFNDWAGALDHVGADMQAFRRDQFRDRQDVADHLLTCQTPAIKGQKLQRAPLRSAFGLPLTFRFGITPKRIREMRIDRLRPEAIEFAPDEMIDGNASTRHPGAASLRLVRLADGWHGAIVRLDGAPVGTHDWSPGGSDDAQKGGQQPARAGATIQGRLLGGSGNHETIDNLPAPGPKIIDFWLDSLKPKAVEVSR